MRNTGGLALWAAVLVFSASAVVLGAAVVEALKVEDLPLATGEGEATEAAWPGGEPDVEAPILPEAPGPGEARGGEGPSVTVYPRVTEAEILDAVNQDMFQPDRTPPLERYLLPSQRPYEAEDSRDDRRRREPELRIVGTAISGDLGLAVVQLEDSMPFAVLVGDMVAGYRVASVSEESVTLTLADEAFTLPVVESDRGRSSSNDRDRNSRNQRATEEAARALSERVQQMLQGMGRGQMGRGAGGSGLPLAGFEIPRVIIQRGGEIPVGVRRTGGGGGGSILP